MQLSERSNSGIMRVLVIDDGSFFCRMLNEKLSRAGFAPWLCPPEELRMTVLKQSWRAAVIGVGCDLSPALSMIREFPDISMAVLMYSPSEKNMRALLDAGAAKCFVMPAPADIVCAELTGMLRRGSEPSMFELTSFLTRKGFPTSNKGFYFLSSAAEMCICEPQLLTDLVAGLYTRVAERYGTTASIVERDMRHLAKLAAKSGAFSALLGVKAGYVPACHEMIRAAADAFVRETRLY
jgi:DNA-binding response OmpR family regulator